MDYSKKNEGLFDHETEAKADIKKAFAKQPEQPKGVALSADFTVPSTRQFKRKIQATYTIRPEIKEGIEQLAAKQGFRSSSAFIDLVLEQVLTQAD
ncbi:hypothetical protein LNP18_06390 [Leuconostoc citreum]|uniref:hypothetical protein n=1 Tax=Leuconostoc citreum TaxID=33964 RepID=UPI00200A73DB|nr:hypothetical protein [Leuconostoc citreum]MCK8605732.1 hypothetical protein [Leuconostoc citreum]